MKMDEQKKHKGSVLVAESAYISQKAQFGLAMGHEQRNQGKNYHLARAKKK